MIGDLRSIATVGYSHGEDVLAPSTATATLGYWAGLLAELARAYGPLGWIGGAVMNGNGVQATDAVSGDGIIVTEAVLWQ